MLNDFETRNCRASSDCASGLSDE